MPSELGFPNPNDEVDILPSRRLVHQVQDLGLRDQRRRKEQE